MYLYILVCIIYNIYNILLYTLKSICIKIKIILKERKGKFEEDKNNPSFKKVVWNRKQRKWAYPFT